MTKRTAAFTALIATALLLAIASVNGQPVAESSVQGDPLPFYDCCCIVFATDNCFFRPDRDPRWIDAPYSFALVFTLPKTPPSFPVSRAPPA